MRLVSTAIHAVTMVATIAATVRVMESPTSRVIQQHQGSGRSLHTIRVSAAARSRHSRGLEETADGIWSIYFNTVLLAKLDERDYIIRG